MLKTRILKNFEKNEEKIKYFSIMGLCMVLSFIASRGTILGYPSPLNVVIVAVSGTYSPYAMVAALLSYLVSGNIFEGLPMIMSIVSLTVIKNLIFKNNLGDYPNIALSLLTGSISLFFGALSSLIIPTTLRITVFRVISSVAIYFLVFVAKDCYEKYRTLGVIELKGINGISLSIVYIMLVEILSSVSLLGINVGRTFGIVIMLLAIKKYKHIGGAICGALTTCGVILCSPDMAENTLLLVISGLICGAFSSFGIIAILIVFISVTIISLMTIGMNPDTFKLFADLIAGVLLYLIIPEEKQLGTLRIFGDTDKSAKITGLATSTKLNFMANSFSDVKKQIVDVSQAVEKKCERKTIRETVIDEMCSNCSMNSICFNKKKEETENAFLSFERKVKAVDKISINDIKKSLPDCINKQSLSNNFNLAHTNRLFEESSSRKLKEMRDFLKTQLETMGNVLDDMSNDISKFTNVDVSLSERATTLFIKNGCKDARVCVYVDERKMLRVEAFYNSCSKPDLIKLTVDISDIIGCDMEMPEIITIGEITRLNFSEKPYFSVDLGSYQKACECYERSGDYFEDININNTEYYVLLSDGMGTGNRARLDSMFTVNLASRLLTSGISDLSSVRLINSVLQVKSWDESFATLDLAKLDLCGGYISFLKAGANASYILRDGAVKKIDGYAFPLGILLETNPRHQRYKLFNNDLIIMCSDGANDNVIRKILSDKSINNLSLNKIAKSIGEQSINSDLKTKKDDITVIVLKINTSPN